MSDIHPDVAAVLSGADRWCVITGDCLEILKTIPSGSVGAVVTDPPYGIGFRSNRRKDKHRAIANDTATDVSSSVVEWAVASASFCSYVFSRWDMVPDLPHKPKSLVTWVKDNWSMGDLKHEHARQTEVAAFYPGPEHEWPDGRPTDVVFASRTKNALHPTEKPVPLMMQILAWTKGVVLDPFCGSGTTGVAAVRMGRRFIGIEIDEHYANIARERIAKAASEIGVPA